jgi:AcrR family transcriptional regulator
VSPDPLPSVASLTTRLGRYNTSALLAVHPAAAEQVVAIRQAAYTAPVVWLAQRESQVPRPRLDDMLLASGLAILRAPLGDHRPGLVTEPWRPSLGGRSRIVLAAQQLLSQRRFRDISVDEVGRLAGLSGPSLYRYYTNKADILTDVCDRATHAVSASALRALNGPKSAPEALDRLIDGYVDCALSMGGLVAVPLRERSSLPEVDRVRLDRGLAEVEEIWAATIAECRPELTAAEAALLAGLSLAIGASAAEVASTDPGWHEEVTHILRAHCWSAAPDLAPTDGSVDLTV